MVHVYCSEWPVRTYITCTDRQTARIFSFIKVCTYAYELNVITYDPSLESPPPPGQALTYFGSAINDTGFIPVGKYGPTGDAITYRRAVLDVATPRDG